MVFEKDIVAVSIPFSAGVAMMAAMPSGIEMSLHIAAISQLAAASLLVMLCMSRRDIPAIPVLFFMLGISCCSNGILFPAADDTQCAIVSDAIVWLHGRIDGTGMGEDATALMKALLTGNRQWLGRETTEAFRSSGASHILALSGLHLGIIYAILHKALSALGNGRAAFISRSVIILATCSFYAAMTGAGPSVTRALLFIYINELSSNAPGRKKKSSSVLLTAMMLQLFFRPLVIRTLAFQLSYLAMAGIIFVYPRLKGWFPERMAGSYPGLLWESLAMSISCQLFTAPLIWYRFGTFPTFFMLTNLIALPLAEAFIILAVILICPLTPGWLCVITKSLAESICQTLIFCMETIASLT